MEKVDEELFAEVYKVIDKRSSEVEDALKASDLASFTTAVHTLKTNCRMIGQLELSEKFFVLEMMGKSGEPDALIKARFYAPQVLEKFRALKPILEPYAQRLSASNSQSLPFSASEMTGLLSEIAEACADFDLDRSEKAAKKLLTYQCDKELYEKLTQLSTYVNELDYDEAEELALQLKDELG